MFIKYVKMVSFRMRKYFLTIPTKGLLILLVQAFLVLKSKLPILRVCYLHRFLYRLLSKLLNDGCDNILSKIPISLIFFYQMMRRSLMI